MPFVHHERLRAGHSRAADGRVRLLGQHLTVVSPVVRPGAVGIRRALVARDDFLALDGGAHAFHVHEQIHAIPLLRRDLLLRAGERLLRAHARGARELKAGRQCERESAVALPVGHVVLLVGGRAG
jgi:hypothetical protein